MIDAKDLPRVQLTGHETDLKNLVVIFNSTKMRVTEIEGLFWLSSDELTPLASEPDLARSQAEQLLPQINTVAKGVHPTFEPVALGECVDWIHPDGRYKRRLKKTVEVRVRSSKVVGAPSAALEEEVKKWLLMEKEGDQFTQILRLWSSSRDHGWDVLYKLGEQIKSAMGDSFAERVVTKTALRRFRHTANSVSALGPASRHGVEKTAPPPRPMPLAEAQQLIDRLVREIVLERSRRTSAP